MCGACIHQQQPCKLFKEMFASVGRNRMCWCVGFVGSREHEAPNW